ncbi:MAG TPA: hypothetical protein PKL04_07480 [Methanofastidiosum sp.]|nr:hypothetical protein [Methanofastidiosum sp.]
MVRSPASKQLFDVYANETKINQQLTFDEASAIVLKLNNETPELNQEEELEV